MEKSKIQWTDHTINFWTGCKKVSDGCKFCYMYRDKERYGKEPSEVVQVSKETINKVLKEAKAGDKIFTCSWSDFFIDEADLWREEAWNIIRDNNHLTWQILTKRPERIMDCLPKDWGEGWDHVWLGVSVESQKFIPRIDILSAIPAKTRFISAEPLIGEIDFSQSAGVIEKFQWCIVGGESGNDTGKYRYRECDIKWIEKILNDLKETNVKVFVKQTGTHLAKQLKLKDRHGGDIEEWPVQIQIRDFPNIKEPILVTEPDIPKEEEPDKTNKMTTNNEILKTTPVFPEKIYSSLPDLLADCTKHFTDSREKDIILTSSLVILSGCFSSCKGKYGNDWLGPNLYSFIVAPPASGKGTMKFAKILGKKIQDDMIDTNNHAKTEFEAQNKIWSKVGAKEGGNPPIKPKYPYHFIPGNSSAAAIYKLLDESNGIGTICESEADTLTGAIKQDWGNFSHLLRSAFQHEDLALSRSGNDVYISIAQPHLSTLLTGTPEQVPRLIASAEDGLSSRFLFYCYSREIKWIDPTPCEACTDLSVFFQELSIEVVEIKKLLDDQKNTFKLSDRQFSSLTDSFSKKLKRVTSFEGDGAVSAVYRLGLIAFRIAMILSIISNRKELATIKEIECSDKDFETVMKLIDVYFEHSMVMYSLLPKQTKRVVNPRLGQFYSLLPKDGKFPRKKANEIGSTIGISEKSVGNYLTELKDDGLVQSPSFGNFELVTFS